MTLFTDSIFLTNDTEGFRVCREQRTSNTATMSVILCRAGYIDVYYHGRMIRIGKDDLFIRIPDFAHELGPYQMSPDFEFSQVTINASIYEKIMFDHMRIEPNWYAKQEYLKEHPIFHIGPKSIEFVDTYLHLLQLQMEDKPTDYRHQIMMLIAHGATMEILNFIDKLAVITPSELDRLSVNQSDYTFHEFTRLLQQYPHEREVQWYAKRMDITPKYLSEICKSVSGKSASEWIADVTVSEIKHMLCDTTLPIHEIARQMEFPNASFFCQYTKKHTGLTPNHFRKQKRN
ncbi:MAG: helix-turn-helix domain-containing protein [Paludibacteraceae bacterium]